MSKEGKMKKVLVLFLLIAMLFGSGVVGFADKPATVTHPIIVLDTNSFVGNVESAYVSLLLADGQEVLCELITKGNTGEHLVPPQFCKADTTLEYFLINGVECYPGRQVLVSPDNEIATTYILDTLEVVYLIEIHDEGRCEVTGDLRYFAGEDVLITGSFTDDNERIDWMGIGMDHYGASVFPNYPVNDFMDLHLELSNNGLTWNWLVEIDGIDSDGRIFVRYEPLP